MEGSRHEVKKALAEMSKTLGTEMPKEFEAIADRVLKKGANPRDALGLSDQMIEGIYGQAYRLYNTGKYKDASDLFRLLIMLNPTEQKYTLGMAACYHMMKEYQAAGHLYTVCAMLDPLSPVPHYHASDCYLQLGDKVSALIALEMAIKRSGDKAEFQQLKDRATLTVNSLREEIEKPKDF
ncbi:MAG: SycD/LcrH family type III secretion system chaperone [Parachlamydiaceae bacterium]|nr:SycD/LcrH family type III secretion system chaperone [Parachlamydiaceae bacterium]